MSSKTGMIALTSPTGSTYYLRASSITTVAAPNPGWNGCPAGTRSVIMSRKNSECIATETPEEVIRLMEEAQGE